MRAMFTQSFKIQAVEKALSRAENTSMLTIADSLGVGRSTLQRWITQSRNQEFESVPEDELSSTDRMTKEKRPQDWSLEEKLNMIMRCASLDDEAISELCREQGIYPHHIKQWKQDFVKETPTNHHTKAQSEVKNLKLENKALKKELRRKEKALAEAAALLMLEKKAAAMWGSDEDDSH